MLSTKTDSGASTTTSSRTETPGLHKCPAASYIGGLLDKANRKIRGSGSVNVKEYTDE